MVCIANLLIDAVSVVLNTYLDCQKILRRPNCCDIYLNAFNIKQNSV